MTDGKALATNKKAYHDYFVEESFEVGIVLTGTEIKSVRQGGVNLKDCYARIAGGEVILINCHISPYSHGTRANHDPLRARKLLLHKKEISRLIGLTQQRGLTLVPLKMYLKGRRAKIELGLVKGKKTHDKRESIKKKIADREVGRALRERTRS
jgi:SsrA-binding protein